MKRKTFIAILAIAMVLVLSLAILTACNNKKHDFSSKWEYDETSHWHECMTKKHSDVADKADHTFDAGVVTTEPTEAAEGVKTLTCTVCGYQKTESVPQLEHTYDMNNWKFDEQTHWHPATCAHTDLKKDEAQHTWNEGVVTTQPTETTEDVKTYTCTVCGNTKTATIGTLEHKHTFDTERWDHDAENHWHPATCAHTSEKKDLAAHSWNEGVVTTQPTETTEGVKTYTCTVCGNTKTATIGTLEHKHTFDTERWDHDAENHWHPATCAHTSEKKGLAAHSWNEGVVTTQPTETTEGVKTYTCTVCGNTKTATIGMLDHKHTFDTERWTYDAENHWHPATCAHTDEKKDLAAHSWNAGVVTTEPNYGVEGEKTFTCTVCKTTRVESVPALAPKTNTISFASDLSLDKTYDGRAVVVAADKVNRKGNGAITIEYMREDESTYSTVAPKDAGTYYVRASVAPTAEWLGGKIEKEFTIEHRTLTLSESVYSRKIDQTLESGKFGLECKNVQEETNNVVTWVTVEVPDQYRAAGIHNIRVGELIVDNQNFVIESNTIVRLTVWDAPEFYAGVQNTFSISGRGTVLEVQIANGTVNVGDQLLINELGKVITVTAIETNRQVLESATAGDTAGLLTKDVTKDEVKRGYTITKLDTVASYDKFTATIRVLETKTTPMQDNYNPNARFVFIDGIGDIQCTIKFPTGSDMLMPGETLAGVTVDFKGATVPAFVGRRFLLIDGSSKTVAEGVITDVAPKTRVNCTVSEPTGKTAVIEPIQGGEKTFALNLNRSTALENIVDSEAIDVVVKYDGVIVGSYKRTGLGVGSGDLAHVENGGTLSGSYININLAKGVSGLTDADGNWICDQANVTFDVSAKQTQQVDNLEAGSVTTISIGSKEVKYFTLNELEPLSSGWYSFVNAFNTSGSSRYELYTDAGVKVDMMSDMFKSTGGKYYVRYTVNANILNAQIGFIAAKEELEATNTTKSLIIPSGKKDDRLVIKVTLNRALSYFHKNTVTFQGNVSAFNGSVVKVYDSNYKFYNGMGYQSLPTGHWFFLPTQNSEQTYAYIMMKYAADLAGTAELKFEHSAAVQLLNSDLQTVPFKANASMNFMFKAPTTGKYKIEIVATGSNALIPPTTISVNMVYDPNLATVTINDNTYFNANTTEGYYSITLKNLTDSAQTVRIHVVKVS